MKITLDMENPLGRCYSPSWERLQKMVSTCFGDKRVKLISISRPDGKCGYRDMGTYKMTALVYDENGCSEEIKLTMNVEL